MVIGEDALRLDGGLWRPTPLGMVGPHGLLAEADDDEMAYRPLLAHHLDARPLTNGLDRAVTVVESYDELVELLRRPDIVPFCPPGVPSARGEESWVRDRKIGVAVHERVGSGLNALLVAGIDPFDSRVAYVSSCRVPNQAILRTMGADETLGAGWLTLFQELALLGAVGITASERNEGRGIVELLRRVAGFRPVAEVFGALGLSPAESAVLLAEWRVTVDDGQVVRFATRPDLDTAARADLVRRLRAYFEVACPQADAAGGSEDDAGPHRFSLGGEVGIGGVAGWGNVVEDDWYQPAPDSPDIQVDAMAASAFLAWLRVEDQPDQR